MKMALMLLAVLMLTGCGDEDGGTTPPDPTEDLSQDAFAVLEGCDPQVTAGELVFETSYCDPQSNCLGCAHNDGFVRLWNRPDDSCTWTLRAIQTPSIDREQDFEGWALEADDMITEWTRRNECPR